MPQGYARCRANKAYTALPTGKGFGVRQGCRDRTPKGFAGRKANKAFLKG